MQKVKLNLYTPLGKLDKIKNHRHTPGDISIASGGRVSRQAIHKILSGKVKGVAFDTLAAILDFFASQGMPITVADLFEVTSEPGFAVVAPNPSYGGLALLRDQGDQSSANPTRTPPTASTPRLIHQLG